MHKLHEWIKKEKKYIAVIVELFVIGFIFVFSFLNKNIMFDSINIGITKIKTNNIMSKLSIVATCCTLIGGLSLSSIINKIRQICSNGVGIKNTIVGNIDRIPKTKIVRIYVYMILEVLLFWCTIIFLDLGLIICTEILNYNSIQTIVYISDGLIISFVILVAIYMKNQIQKFEIKWIVKKMVWGLILTFICMIVISMLFYYRPNKSLCIKLAISIICIWTLVFGKICLDFIRIFIDKIVEDENKSFFYKFIQAIQFIIITIMIFQSGLAGNWELLDIAYIIYVLAVLMECLWFFSNGVKERVKKEIILNDGKEIVLNGKIWQLACERIGYEQLNGGKAIIDGRNIKCVKFHYKICSFLLKFINHRKVVVEFDSVKDPDEYYKYLIKQNWIWLFKIENKTKYIIIRPMSHLTKLTVDNASQKYYGLIKF